MVSVKLLSCYYSFFHTYISDIFLFKLAIKYMSLKNLNDKRLYPKNLVKYLTLKTDITSTKSEDLENRSNAFLSKLRRFIDKKTEKEYGMEHLRLIYNLHPLLRAKVKFNKNVFSFCIFNFLVVRVIHIIFLDIRMFYKF